MTATEVTPYKITHRHSLQLSGTPFLTLESSLSQCQEGPSPPVLLHIENLEGYFAVLHKNTRRLARRKKHAASTAYIIGLAAWYKCNLKATGFFTLPPLPNTESPSMSSHPYHHWQPYVKLNSLLWSSNQPTPVPLKSAPVTKSSYHTPIQKARCRQKSMRFDGLA